MKPALLALPLLLLACSARTFDPRRLAADFAAAEAAYGKDLLDGPQHAAALEAAYAAQGGRLTPERARALRDEDLAPAFQALATLVFYAPKRTHAEDSLVLLRELEVRGLRTEAQVREAHEGLLRARLLAEARDLQARSAALKLEGVPPIAGEGMEPQPFSVLALSEDGRSYAVESLPLEQGPRVVVLSSPHCGFSQKALDALQGDAGLKAAFERSASFVVPPQGSLEPAPFAAWRARHPWLRPKLIYRPEDWEGKGLSGATPTFYFLKDGRLEKKVNSWSPVLAGVPSGKFRRAPGTGGQSMGTSAGVPSMLASGIVAPTSSTLSPWTLAHEQISAPKVGLQSPFISVIGVSAAHAQKAAAKRGTDNDVMRRRMATSGT